MKKKIKKILKILFWCLTTVFLFLLTSYLWPMPDLPIPYKSKSITINRINIIDIHSGHILENRDVIIRDNRIISIDSGYQKNDNLSDTTIDGNGKFLIPGLWDMHTHSTQHSPWLHHPLYIANGVTGIRDMSGQMGEKDSYWAGTLDRLSWNNKIETGELVSPRYVLQSSFQINGANSVPGSFPEFFKMEKTEDVPLLLSHYQNEGTDFIKVYSEIPPHTYRVLAEQAPDYGMHIAGHKVLGVTLKEAILAGQRSFEHGRVFMFDCFPGAEELRKADDKRAMYRKAKPSMANEFDSQKAEQLMDLMNSLEAYWVPTLQTLKSSAFADDSTYLSNEHLQYIPRMRKTLWWNPDINNAAAYNRSEEGKGINKKLYESAKKQLFMAYQRGVPILAGTDVTDSYTFAGYSLHQELQEFTDAGLTNLYALQSATIAPARYCKVEKDYGSVEVGKMADLVLLDKNPLDDIAHTQSISGVIFNGNYYDKNTLESYKKATSDIASSFHLNVKFVASLLGSPLMRVQLVD